MFSKYIKRIGAGIGIICIPFAIIDTIGCPVQISGSSMEVNH